MKDATKKALKSMKMLALVDAIILLFVGIGGFAIDGPSPTGSLLVVIALCGFAMIVIKISSILKAEE